MIQPSSYYAWISHERPSLIFIGVEFWFVFYFYVFSRESWMVQRWATGWMIGDSIPGKGWERWGVKVTNDLHLVPESRKRGVDPQYAFMAWFSDKSQGQLYLYLTCLCLELVWTTRRRFL